MTVEDILQIIDAAGTEAWALLGWVGVVGIIWIVVWRGVKC